MRWAAATCLLAAVGLPGMSWADWQLVRIESGGLITLKSPDRDMQQVQLETVTWPDVRDSESVLAEWRHALSLGRIGWDGLTLTSAGIPVDEVLVAQGSAVPTISAGPNVWERFNARLRAGLDVFSPGRGVLTGAASDLKLRLRGPNNGVSTYLIDATVETIVDNGALTLAGNFADGSDAESWEMHTLWVPGPSTLTVDGLSYTPVTLAGYYNKTLFINSDLGLFCTSAGDSQNQPSANVLAVVDNRVLPLDGSANAFMPTILSRPVPGHELVLHSRHGDVVCGEPDVPFWIHGDRFETGGMADPFQPVVPITVLAD